MESKPPKSPTPERREGPVSVDEAREILGQEMVKGPEEIQKTFGIILETSKIPPIPFDRDQLRRAAKAGVRLLLRVDQDGQGGGLTIEKMQALYRQQGKGSLVADWSANNPLLQEAFLREEKPKTRWTLVGRYLTMEPGETSPFEQTEMLLNQQDKQGRKDSSQLRRRLKELVAASYGAGASNEERERSRQQALKQLFKEFPLYAEQVRTASEVVYDTALAGGGPSDGYKKATFDVSTQEIGFYTSTFSEKGIVWVKDSGQGMATIVNSRGGWPRNTGMVAVK